MIYYILYLKLSVLSIIEIFSSRSVLSKFVPGIVFFFIVFSGTRHWVGYDYGAYVDLFYMQGGNNEVGFRMLIDLLQYFSSSFGLLFFVMALISISIKSYCIAKLSPYFFLSFSLYFVQDYLARDFGNIRQGVSIAFTFLSFYYYVNRRAVISFFSAIFALFFHYSAVVYLIWLIYDKFRLGNVSMLVCLVLGFSLGQLLDADLIRYALKYINIDYLHKKLTDYSLRLEYSSPLGVTPGLMVRVILFSSLIYFQSAFRKKIYYYQQLKSATFFGLMLFLIFNSFEIIAVRTSLYFRIFDVITISLLLWLIRDCYQKLFLYAFVFFYAFQGLYRELERHGVYFDYDSWLF